MARWAERGIILKMDFLVGMILVKGMARRQIVIKLGVV